jgi:hypothetical protein
VYYIGNHSEGGDENGMENPEYNGANKDTANHFSANTMCFGCHGDLVPYYECEWVCRPFIRTNPHGISPGAGQAGAHVELSGACFGDADEAGRAVQLKSRLEGTEWIDMPIDSWADDRVVFEIPCRTLAPGNYWVRTLNERGQSNQAVFTFKGDG